MAVILLPRISGATINIAVSFARDELLFLTIFLKKTGNFAQSLKNL
jgi:hypothetical protein